MTWSAATPAFFSFLKPFNFRQQSLFGERTFKSPNRKSSSNFITTMDKALLEGELLLSKKVLVVEDTYDLREMLGTILSARGWQPILAESGEKALDKLERETPSVILMDMRMPVMNGFELATILKNHRVYRNIPILAATAFPDPIARQQCLAAGCDDFISKPFAFAALEMQLTNLVSADHDG
jgi:CheY-like chemotaxis protein